MSIEVEFISKNLIKPSSLTPDDLRHYQLCFLDQIEPHIFLPYVMFYKNNPNISNSEICNALKQSLSQMLNHYYPLAGRVENNSYVNCNDEGVPFVEAKANCDLSIILRDRLPSHNKKFIPIEHDNGGDLLAFSQITYFKCGGFALSFGISHKIADGISEVIFINTWSEIARGKTEIKTPFFHWATFFPPLNMSTYEPEKLVTREEIVTKIFHFDASTVNALVAKYTVDGIRPTRVEALVIFIWSRFMATTQAKEAKNKVYTVIQGVNLRSRTEPPLPLPTFGNLVWVAIAKADMEAKEDETYGIFKRMKDSIRNINADLVKKLQNSDEQVDLMKQVAEGCIGEEVVNFTFSSLCNLGQYYSPDFGWGEPVWGGLLPHVAKNMAIFFDAQGGKGIEAWVSLKVEDMAKFEDDKEDLAHVSSPKEIPSRL